MIVQKSIFFLLSTFIVSNRQVKTQSSFLPNLPVGPYKILFEAVYPCESTVNHKIGFNWYLSRQSLNTTFIMGNVTTKIPIDNKLGVDFNMAVMSSMGGWKDNAYVLRTENNAYDTAKTLLGSFWTTALKAFNAPLTYPIPPGIYVTSGLNKDAIANNSLPKSFFYGKYKISLKIKDKNKDLMGCLTIVTDIKRPWET